MQQEFLNMQHQFQLQMEQMLHEFSKQLASHDANLNKQLLETQAGQISGLIILQQQENWRKYMTMLRVKDTDDNA